MERYFLGNNSGYGFWNDYDAELKGKDRVALLKGGPGTGKSTLMKKIAEYAKKAGHDIELWYCSGDPNSLDGVCIKDTNRAVVDATAPHASGVDIPVVKDRIFDLAQSLKPYKLRGVREDIEKLMNCKKQCFMRAYQHLKSALCHCDNKMQLEKQTVDEGGVRAYAYKIADVLRCEKSDMKESEWGRRANPGPGPGRCFHENRGHHRRQLRHGPGVCPAAATGGGLRRAVGHCPAGRGPGGPEAPGALPGAGGVSGSSEPRQLPAV